MMRLMKKWRMVRGTDPSEPHKWMPPVQEVTRLLILSSNSWWPKMEERVKRFRSLILSILLVVRKPDKPVLQVIDWKKVAQLTEVSQFLVNASVHWLTKLLVRERMLLYLIEMLHWQESCRLLLVVILKLLWSVLFHLLLWTMKKLYQL